MADFKWKDSEKKIANRAYEKARIAELDEIVQSFKTDATKISDPDQLWALVDGMKNKRYEFEQKYDYRYSVLITVLARLLAERRISTDDLARLDEDKLAAIVARADFFVSWAINQMTSVSFCRCICYSIGTNLVAVRAAWPNHSLNRTHCGMRQKARHFILGL